MTVTIYHNPRCSKSRQTLELLRGRGIQPEIIEYLQTPPNERTLKGIIEQLGVEPRDLMRRKEAAYKQLGLDNPALTRAALIKAMVEHPVLIERPIVCTKDKSALGRPPEAVLQIL